MENNNIFENACLIQLKTSCWTGAKQIADGSMAHIANVDPEWLKAKKYLVNPEYLAPVKTAIYKARRALSSHALPFPLNSLCLVPKESIMVIEEKLRLAKQEFQQEVDTFCAGYDVACQEAAIYLGSHFSNLDYPMDVRSKFRLQWRFVALSVPEKASILPANLYEAERQKFIALMDEARELAVISLREEFAAIVAHLVERLSENGEDEKPKILKNGMFTRFNEFMDNFSTRNLFQDDALSALVTQAKNCISGLDSQTVKTNGWLKNTLADEMTKLKTQIDSAIEEMPRRYIRYADRAMSELPVADAA